MARPLDSVIQRAFAGGELAPALHARADLARYTTGLRTCRNWFVRKEGGVSNRPGTRFLAEAGEPDNLVKLYRWVFTAAEQSTLIEAGDHYFRFYQQGARLAVDPGDVAAWDIGTPYVAGDLVSALGLVYYATGATLGDPPASGEPWYLLPVDNDGFAIYQIPTPYAAGAFNSPGPLRVVQSGPVLTITHTAYPPMELQNLDVLGSSPAWVLVPVSTDPSIAAPTGLTWTPGIPGPSGGHTYSYVVTAVKEETYEESLPSAPDQAAGVGFPTTLAPNVITWDPVPGAVEYRVYLDAYNNGTFGYIGTATGQTTFHDTGVAPDFELTPPVQRTLFASPLNYPEMSAYYQQRRCFAYTDNQPSTVWGSRIGYRSNFTIRSPIQDDDAITFTLAGNDMSVIRHLIALKRLVLLTDTGEWIVRGGEDGVLRPTTINPDQQGFAGSSRATPAIVSGDLVYVQARGSQVRALRFSPEGQTADSLDLTIFAAHLFERQTVSRLEFQHDPDSIVWAVRDDGVLLGLTYLPQYDVWGWHRHDTLGGTIEDVCVVPEPEGDVVYLVVRREIDGELRRYIEKLESRVVDEATFERDAFFVDCGLTYDGTPTTTIEGLDHLEGETVAVVADGAVVFDGDPFDPLAATYQVTGGAIHLPTAASIVHVGLRIANADLETLDLDTAGSNVRDKKKRVQSLGMLLERSVRGFSAGPDADHLFPVRPDTWDHDRLVTRRQEINLTTTWSDEGRVFIRQTQPMPVTVLAVMPFVEVQG